MSPLDFALVRLPPSICSYVSPLVYHFNIIAFFGRSENEYTLIKNELFITIKFIGIIFLYNISVTLDIAYTKQRENHGTMIPHGVSYSAYTLRYGLYACMLLLLLMLLIHTFSVLSLQLKKLR